MKYIGFLLLILVYGCGTSGNVPQKNTPAVSSLQTCLRHYQDEKWKDALLCLDQLPDTARDQTYYDLRGSILAQSGNPQEAIIAFQKALDLDVHHQNPYLHFKLGQSLWQEHRFQEAGVAMKDYQKAVENPRPDITKQTEYYLRSYRVADSLYQAPREFDPQPLSDSINSEGDELGLSMTYDRRHMILTRRSNQEDLYESRIHDGQWTKASPLDALNSPDNEGAVSLSGDGSLLVFTACNRAENIGSCDLYYSARTDTGWTSPQLMPGINSRAWDSQPTLSADGRAIIFCSERPGGFGGRDLWLTVRGEEGWIEPINLGPTVNSPGNEENPFLHSNENTLYFTSDYWPGFGGRDLFLTHRIRGNEWSEIRNLGYPINSVEHEEGIFIESSGRKGYFSSARGGRFDLYSFEVDPAIRPRPTFLYKMVVVHSETDQSIEGATVDAYDWTQQKVVRHTTTDLEGFAAFLIEGDRRYGITVSKSDYLLHSFSKTMSNDLTGDQTDTIRLHPVKDTSTLILENVLFATGEARLLEGSGTELDQLAEYLKQNSDITIRLTGHTDNVGKPEDNLDLSRERAAAVRDYLTGRGIDLDRITAVGKGESQPIASNDTGEGRQKNRRTEITIIR